MSIPRAAAVALLLLSLPGCHATLYGNQSTSGGATTTTTASHVSGSTQFSGGRASFSSGGHPLPANAPGGTLKVSGSAAGVLVVGVVIADLFYYMVGPSQPKPLAPDARIADTCSCYRKAGDEVTK
jgi:hypothetical protein